METKTETKIEYVIDQERCLRTSVQNLLEVTTEKMAKADPLTNFMRTAIKEFKPANLGDIDIDNATQQDLQKKLKELYTSDPIHSTKVNLAVCGVCKDNSICEQYQDYLKIIEQH
jgi:hypothetical protein